MAENQTTVQSLSDVQDKNFIWTWKSNGRGNKCSIWLPYFKDVHKVKKNWVAAYNGGELELDLARIDLIMFYGATGSIPLEFLDDLSKHGIVLMLHRRNIARPYICFPSNIGDQADVLSKQLVFRLNETKKAYIARLLIKQRFAQMSPWLNVSGVAYEELAKARNVTKVRATEARITAIFWKNWFEQLGIDEKRRGDSAVAQALNAGSKFLYGVILRWILFHKMSPCHGYLHEPTDYPSLVYDLIEPYRYVIEQTVFDIVKLQPKLADDSKTLVSRTLDGLKENLDEVVYVPATLQYVRRKNLLHGIVLALRSYLLGESKRFVIPYEGERKGGRPPQVAYKLPGEKRP